MRNLNMVVVAGNLEVAFRQIEIIERLLSNVTDESVDSCMSSLKKLRMCLNATEKELGIREPSDKKGDANIENDIRSREYFNEAFEQMLADGKPLSERLKDSGWKLYSEIIEVHKGTDTQLVSRLITDVVCRYIYDKEVEEVHLEQLTSAGFADPANERMSFETFKSNPTVALDFDKLPPFANQVVEHLSGFNGTPLEISQKFHKYVLQASVGEFDPFI